MSNHEPSSFKRVGAFYQVTTFLVTVLILTGLFAIHHQSFRPKDPVYQLKKNKNGALHTITAGLHIAHFNKFFVSQNIFEFDGTIWFSFDPAVVSLDVIKKFTIHNGEILKISGPILYQKDDKTIAQFRAHISFHTPLNYRMFPFDDHRINIIIANDFLPDNVAFTASINTFTFEKPINLPGWNIINYEPHTGYTQAMLELNGPHNNKRQETVFSLSIARNDPMLATNIFLTLLLMLFIALLTFSSNEDCVLIVTVGIVALVGYRVVMQELTPNHMSYFIFADFIYFFTLIGTILALLGGIITREHNNSVARQKLIIAGIYGLLLTGSIIISLFL